MKWFFNVVTTLSLRFRALTLILVVLFMVLGAVSTVQLNQELLPPVDLPQTFILAQASGMTSEQVMSVLTERLEPGLNEIDDVINLESTTTGTFGTAITAFNDFGINQERLREDIQTAIDEVWLPLRRIELQEGQTSEALLAELSSDLLIYLAEANPNFVFQLSPEVWSAFSDETIEEVLAYLASRANTAEDNRGALQRLVENQLVPQLRNLEIVANVAVSGGQELPGEENTLTVAEEEIEEVADDNTLLFRLSSDVWVVISERFEQFDALDVSAVGALADVEFNVVTEPPALPESWLRAQFHNASDLVELSSLTVPLADIFNDFLEDGEIVGSLGQTDDLTPEVVRQYLDIEPTLVNHFDAEHLSAMSSDVFDVLFEYDIELDGFARDALAAAALASNISGEDVERSPVNLPSSWRIAPPRLITFSFADAPLATFSVSTTGVTSIPVADDDVANNEVEVTDDNAPEIVQDTTLDDLPEGPELPLAVASLGSVFGIELETARDLLSIQFPEEFARCTGISTIAASALLNLAVTPLPTAATSSLPEGCEDVIGDNSVPDGASEFLIGSLSVELMEYLAEYDSNFTSDLDSAVYDLLSDEVLFIDGFAPPLADAWSVLANQPQFATMPLVTAADVVEVGNGEASSILNLINSEIPAQFEGYEVRLFDSLSSGVVRYFALAEDNFYQNLDVEVVRKFSAGTLSVLPEGYLSSLDAEVAQELTAIASGETDSAFAVLEAEFYSSDVLPADPTAPALNPAWQEVVGFFPGISSLDNAYDLFRFPDASGTPAAFINGFFNDAGGRSFAPRLIGNMSAEAFAFIAENDPNFVNDLRPEAVLLLSDEIKTTLPDEVLTRAEEGGQRFSPTNQVTRTNGSLSLLVTIFKTTDSNIIQAYDNVEEVILELDAANNDIEVRLVSEQASFVEESISGVAREGVLGAVFAIIIILIFLSAGTWTRGPRRQVGIGMVVVFAALTAFFIFGNVTDVVWWAIPVIGWIGTAIVLLWPADLPDPAWRATLVIAVSIPLSILTAFVGMRWFSPAMYDLISPLAEDSEFFSFLLRLFPESLTLNIMTLSGLTVAVGRVVDDSIVVLENIFRQMQSGQSKREAVLAGTRDVSSAIFVATLIAVVVFLPLGLTGGLISEFFLPFGLSVTYALAGSFVVSITVVPVLAYLFLSAEDMPEEEEIWLARFYLPVLRWALASGRNRAIVVALAIISFLFSGFLFGQRPFAFLPNFGEPQVTVSVDLPSSTSILETNALVLQLEEYLRDEIPEEQLETIQTTVGGGGLDFEALITGGSVAENRANITAALHVSSDELDIWTQTVREQANTIFGEGNVVVSAASASDGGFGGLALVVSGPQDMLAELDPLIIETLDGIEGITNVSSNLSDALANADGPATYIRVNLESAASYIAELETDNTIGVTNEAILAIQELPEITDDIQVSQGFQSELQTEGFQSLIVAMGIAMVIVIVILIFTFNSLVYWWAIILSVVVAPVGAAIALTLTDRVLGISALIGMLMLLGLVITNAVVLIDRVRSNLFERDMELYDALIEAGDRRLRPILMTSLATIIALLPLTIGLSEGAIIASELGTVVVGGVFSSTLLTLIVVPVMYGLLTPLQRFLSGLVGIKSK